LKFNWLIKPEKYYGVLIFCAGKFEIQLNSLSVNPVKGAMSALSTAS